MIKGKIIGAGVFYSEDEVLTVTEDDNVLTISYKNEALGIPLGRADDLRSLLTEVLTAIGNLR